jgi:hypothetical protein
LVSWSLITMSAGPSAGSTSNFLNISGFRD